MSTLVLLVVGAALGALFAWLPSILRTTRTRYGKWQAARHQQLILDGTVDWWLLQYYNREQSIFRAQIGDCERDIPVLTRPAWIFRRTIEPTSDWLLEMREAAALPFQINQRILRWHSRLGGRLFEAWRESIYLDNLEESQDYPYLHVRPCHYFEIASSILELQRETLRAATLSQSRLLRHVVRTPVRDRLFPNLPEVLGLREAPFSVGSTALLALRVGSTYEIAVQTRSSEVVTAPGLKAVIPNFGFEANWLGETKSSYGLVYFNFLKEYLEELFDYEALIGEVGQRRVQPDWFRNLPEARALNRAHAGGRFSIDFLGLGIDAISGTTVVALLAVIDDDVLAAKIRRNLTPNWEVAATGDAVAPVEFVDINDTRLAYWHRRRLFQASSAFTLALGLSALAERQHEREVADG